VVGQCKKHVLTMYPLHEFLKQNPCTTVPTNNNKPRAKIHIAYMFASCMPCLLYPLYI